MEGLERIVDRGTGMPSSFSTTMFDVPGPTKKVFQR
jgi:hypothetical protein